MTLATGTHYGLTLFFVVFQRVGGEILHSFSRPTCGVSSSRSLLGSSLSFLSGSCHVRIMPQAATPVLHNCVGRSPHSENPTFRDLTDRTSLRADLYAAFATGGFGRSLVRCRIDRRGDRRERVEACELLSTAYPGAEPIHVQIDHRRRVKREHLADDKPSDDSDA